MITALFPEGVIAVTASGAMRTDRLLPGEDVAIRRAAPRRRRQFTAGRVCAREALAKLGIEDFPLLAGRDRLPGWPPGVVGSISHTDGYCAAVVALTERFAGLGLDVEGTRPLSPRVAARVCAASELERLEGVAAPPGTAWTKLLFSAKESTYKCYFPPTRAFLGFDDVTVTLDPESASFTALIVRASAPPALGYREFRGRFAHNGRHVFTAVTLPAQSAQSAQSTPS